MAKLLEQACQWHELYCYEMEVMSLNPSRVELGVPSPKSYLNQEQLRRIVHDCKCFSHILVVAIHRFSSERK